MAATPTRRVVIIDDIASSGRSLQSRLADGVPGLEIQLFTDPAEGLRQIVDRPVDLVFVDYVMPGMDGVEVIRRFRRRPDREEVPVIMITGMDDETVLTDAFKAGANDFLNKSVSSAELIARTINMLALRSRSLALAEKTRRLYELATTDPLTRAYNRRHFLEHAQRKMAEMRRSGAPFALILLDADHFKRINDDHGHAAGDKVLMSVVDRCRETIREVDQVGRMGGEEFAICLANTGGEGARGLADRLRARIEASPTRVDEENIRVTVSIGVTEAAIGDRDLDQVMKRADDALYQAKKDGRNRVVLG